MIGLIIALDNESKNLMSILKDRKTITENAFDFTTGTINGVNVVITTCGIGKVLAASATALMIHVFKPKLIISTGVAGGLNRSEVLDIIIAESVVIHDFDITLGRERGLLPIIDRVRIETDDLANCYLLEAIPNARKGIVATGDQFIASDDIAKKIVEYFDASACDMECGAVGYIATLNKVPFVAIKVISDSAGESAESSFMNFLLKAASINSDAVIKVLPLLEKAYC
ncbi:MAG: 5'-methylthioadenosine/adenosylhomocysteine nucleosidase [Christensenellaceae bacterium]|jgi:adenosylhomocysteine nucleosidase|nr:5'-methylthioadenosine/adenosylhomocysteine nucleosidase [Christensenellaceae bacterium]